MTYSAMVAMANSTSLRGRIVACAAEQSVTDPPGWVQGNLWRVVSQPGWADKWTFAVDNLSVNAQPDLGVRTDVISDADILTAVQALNPPA